MPATKKEFVYNPALKSEFVEGHVDKTLRQRTRSLMTDFENILQKDIKDATLEEALGSIVQSEIYAPSSICYILKAFRKYADFCGAKGECNKYVSGFFLLTYSDIPMDEIVKRSFVFHTGELREKIAADFRGNDECMGKGIALNYVPSAMILSWSGLQYPETIMESDVDYEGRTVQGVRIEDELWDVVCSYGKTDYANLETYHGLQPFYKIPGETFLRSKEWGAAKTARRAALNRNVLVGAVAKAVRDCKFELKNLYIAGLMSRLKGVTSPENLERGDIVCDRLPIVFEDLKELFQVYCQLS